MWGVLVSNDDCVHFLHTPDDDHVNPDLHSQLQLLLQTMSPEIIPAATVAGDASILREYLTKYPHEVASYVHCPILLIHAWQEYIETECHNCQPHSQAFPGSNFRSLAYEVCMSLPNLSVRLQNLKRYFGVCSLSSCTMWCCKIHS